MISPKRSATLHFAVALAVLMGGLAAPAGAETILASNYASSYTSWTGGSNQSTNFGSWTFNTNNGGSLFAGGFLGDSTAGAGNVNTSGSSFALYANPGGSPGAFIDAIMGLNGQLVAGTKLRFSLGVNFDNGNKGFSLLNADNTQELLNWNLGGGASTSSGFTRNQTTGTYNYGGNDAVLNVELSMTSSTEMSYLISRTSSQGTQGTLFAGTVTGISVAPANLKFYNSSTDNGNAQNNLYFNSVEVVPEPQSLALLACGGASLLVLGYGRSRKARRG